MEAQDLETAAEFCKLVGSPHLLAYLGTDENADSGDARAKLKSRRKFMQGMQGNPKYKKEALFLIKHFSSLNEVLGDLPVYMADAGRRAESEHLPVLEMTMRGALAAGGLSADLEDYLRRNALELGVSESTYRELLHRIAKEMGIPMRGGLPTPAPPPGRDSPMDLYQLLGISPHAQLDEIRVAYEMRLGELDRSDPNSEALRRRIEIARKVLSNEAARRHYDLTAARTGPPARAREFRPDQAATAPPVRERTFDPRVGQTVEEDTSRLEILGDPVRTVRLARGTTSSSITIRNGGEGPMGGVVTADVPWMTVHPTRLDPRERQQDVAVQIDGSHVPDTATTSVVTIQTDRGERARVVFELERGTRSAWIWGLIVAAVLLAAVLVGLLPQSL